MTSLSLEVARTESDREKCFDIRRSVFIVEQKCPPKLEWDDFEHSATHFLAWSEDKIVGTARMREVTHDGTAVAKLERFAVMREWRGRGFGRLLIQAVIDYASDQGYTRFFLHAQEHLEELYASFGFQRVGDVFMEAGIPHLPMAMNLQPNGQTDN